MTYLLGSVIVGVKLSVKPTVLYAEKHSKTTASKSVSGGSKIKMATIAEPITMSEIHKMANAREVDSLVILRPKISILLLPLATEIIFSVANAKVLVFIPPPVDAGEAPTHIKKMINPGRTWPHRPCAGRRRRAPAVQPGVARGEADPTAAVRGGRATPPPSAASRASSWR